MRQVVLDTETTGLSPKNGDRIIEIGCVEIVNRKITGEVYHQYINPEREVSQGAFQVHGLSTQFLQDKPLFEEIIPKLKDFLEGAELIIHNAPFDVGFLEYEFGLLGDEWENLDEFCTITDTLAMARKKHPGQKNNLDVLCKRYGVDNSMRDKHGALLDSEILAELYLVMTGGQRKMALETAQAAKAKKSVSKVFVDLPVIRANDKESQAHEQYVEDMSQKGSCLFKDLTARGEVE